MNTDIENIQKHIRKKISREAEEWFVKLQSGPVTKPDLESLNVWLKQDPAHKKEIDRWCTIWEGAAALKNEPEIQEILAQSQTPAADSPETVQKQRRHKTRMPALKFAIAASVVLIVGGIWLKQFGAIAEKTYRTATGIQKSIYLADGSTIELDTESVVTTKFSNELRTVKLSQGRALFTVAHDPERAFVVSSGKIKIRALGTVFNVYKKKTGTVSIAVTEGRIKVSRVNGAHPGETAPGIATTEKQNGTLNKETGPNADTQNLLTERILVSGQKLVVDEQDAVYNIQPIDKDRVNAWRDGRLYFRARPLIEVIDETNRYMETKMEIADPDLENLKVSLNFFVSHRNDFLSTLEKTFPIVSRTSRTGRILLTKRE